MTTFKKLAFCSTCAVILLGAAPKTVADNSTLKNEIQKEKTIAQESSLKKAVSGCIETGTTVGKSLIGGGLLLSGVWLWEDMPGNHKVTAFIAGLLGIGGGGTIASWGVHDIYTAILKKSNEAEEKRLRKIFKKY